MPIRHQNTCFFLVHTLSPFAYEVVFNDCSLTVGYMLVVYLCFEITSDILEKSSDECTNSHICYSDCSNTFSMFYASSFVPCGPLGVSYIHHTPLLQYSLVASLKENILLGEHIRNAKPRAWHQCTVWHSDSSGLTVVPSAVFTVTQHISGSWATTTLILNSFSDMVSTSLS